MNKGKTWSKPQAVVAPYYGAFRFFPAIGVQASTGDVHVSFYDNVRYSTRDIYGYYYRKTDANLRPLTGETLASTTPIVPAFAFFGGAFFGDYTQIGNVARRREPYMDGKSERRATCRKHPRSLNRASASKSQRRDRSQGERLFRFTPRDLKAGA